MGIRRRRSSGGRVHARHKPLRKVQSRDFLVPLRGCCKVLEGCCSKSEWMRASPKMSAAVVID